MATFTGVLSDLTEIVTYGTSFPYNYDEFGQPKSVEINGVGNGGENIRITMNGSFADTSGGVDFLGGYVTSMKIYIDGSLTLNAFGIDSIAIGDIIETGFGPDFIYTMNVFSGDSLLAGADSFYFDSSETINGDSGNDEMYGRGGVDRFYGDYGQDKLVGAGGNDFLSGGHGRDTLIGGKGEDILRGGKKGDVLKGGGDNDTILGGRGSDTIYGGKGDDYLTGGTGADLFVFTANKGAGSDRVLDFQDGIDKLSFVDLAPEDVTIIDGPGGVLVSASDFYVLVESMTTADFTVDDILFAVT